MKRSEKALELFSKEYNCSQSVLLSFADEVNIDEDTLIKISSGFGEGTARLQGTCGAINGGVILLGLIFGNGINGNTDDKEVVYEKTQHFIQLFNKQFSTTQCKELLYGCEALTEQEHIEYYEKNHNKICKTSVKFAVEILEKLIHY